MNVANILPGDDVKVQLRYTELLVPQGGNYQFVFPTVVGPRYNGPQSHNAQAAWVAQPVLRADVAPSTGFQLKVALDTPLGIQEVRSLTHAIEVRQRDRNEHADIALTRSSEPADNRDFVLDYRLTGEHIESGLMLYKGQGDNAENFFLAMGEPPKSVAASAISPRDYIFVVDISSRCTAFRLTRLRSCWRVHRRLRPSDTFNVLLFRAVTVTLAASVPATRNIGWRLHDPQRSGGGKQSLTMKRLCRTQVRRVPQYRGVDYESRSSAKPSSWCARTSRRPTCSPSASAHRSTGT
jgi:Ca-activated chloride channel family protein